jgi:hypothetical protein
VDAIEDYAQRNNLTRSNAIAKLIQSGLPLGYYDPDAVDEDSMPA